MVNLLNLLNALKFWLLSIFTNQPAQVHNEKAILFAPRLDNLYKIWMTVKDSAQMTSHYEIETKYIDEMEVFISENYNGLMYVNEGVNSDSGITTQIPDQKYLEGKKVDRKIMHDILAESRVIKNDEEI